MTANQIKHATMTQKFFNEFSQKAMSSRSDVSTTMTQSVEIAFQFKCFDILEERRVEIYRHKNIATIVYFAKKKAVDNKLTDQREFVLTDISFDHILKEAVEFFEKEIN